MRIAFVTPSLNIGGAERFLLRLSIELVSQGHEVRIHCLARDGDLKPEFAAAGIPVTFLHLDAEQSVVSAVASLADMMETDKPDVVQGLMYLGDAFSAAAAVIARHQAMFWSIRTSRLPKEMPVTRRLLPFALAPASHLLPRRIISCSPEASRVHVSRGYALRKITHVPNSVESWAVSTSSRSRLLTADEGPIRIGMAARYDAGKGHLDLVQAVHALRQRGLHALATFVGRGTEPGGALDRDITRLGLQHVPVELGGIRGPDEMAKWMGDEIDIYVMGSSCWEAFPNSLAEASTMGVPSLAVDVGSSWRLVPKVSRVSSSRPEFLVAGVEQLTALSPDVRQRVFVGNSKELRSRLNSTEVARRYVEVWSR